MRKLPDWERMEAALRGAGVLPGSMTGCRGREWSMAFERPRGNVSRDIATRAKGGYALRRSVISPATAGRTDPSPVIELNRAVAVAMDDGGGTQLIDTILAHGGRGVPPGALGAGGRPFGETTPRSSPPPTSAAMLVGAGKPACRHGAERLA
jgi:hypothetical protein